MKAAPPSPSHRALAIANGLIRSGRAAHPQVCGGFIRLAGASGEHYFVTFDGERLLRGDTVQDASDLHERFIDTMARKGLIATVLGSPNLLKPQGGASMRSKAGENRSDQDSVIGPRQAALIVDESGALSFRMPDYADDEPVPQMVLFLGAVMILAQREEWRAEVLATLYRD